MGNFYFILDFDLLTVANSTAGPKFASPGAPERARIYQRVAAGEMPPAGQMPRPTKEDLTVLRDWIASCLVQGSAPVGGRDGATAPDVGQPDHGDGGPDPVGGCGGPAQECCPGNSCNGGGCCVLGECRASGAACNDGPGTGRVPGMCMNGSCVDAGVACGSVPQACCPGGSCTATRAYCGTGMKCAVCGAMGQACCGTGGGGTCLAGLDCQGDRFPLAGSCRPCGAMGQRCCGNGPATTQKCNTGLTCRFDVNLSDAICAR